MDASNTIFLLLLYSPHHSPSSLYPLPLLKLEGTERERERERERKERRERREDQ